MPRLLPPRGYNSELGVFQVRGDAVTRCLWYGRVLSSWTCLGSEARYVLRYKLRNTSIDDSATRFESPDNSDGGKASWMQVGCVHAQHTVMILYSTVLPVCVTW